MGLVATRSDGAVDMMGGDFGSNVFVAGRNGSPAVASVGGRSLREVSEEGTAPGRGEGEYINLWMAYLLPGSPSQVANGTGSTSYLYIFICNAIFARTFAVTNFSS